MSVWPWRAVLYLVAFIAGGLVSWVAVASVFLFPVWAGVWARVERRLAVLVGGERVSGEWRGGVSWRALVHCLVSVPLSVLGVMGVVGLVAALMSTLLVSLQPVAAFDRLWWFNPRTTAGALGAIGAGVLLVPVAGWLVAALAVGVESLCAGILSPRAEALARQVDSLRAASLRAEDDVLAERRRLQQHLHDGVQLHLSVTGTRLAVLEYDIEQVQQDWLRADLLRSVDSVRDELQVAMGEVRNAVANLAPRRLIDEGLCAALSELGDRMPVPTRVDCRVPRLPPAVEADLYLIVSESLANVVKHARAGSVVVTARSDGAGVVLSVRDDGVGGVDVPGGGVLGMWARAERRGGTVSIDSPTGGGTSVVVRLPEVGV